jgi:hypothetical protein
LGFICADCSFASLFSVTNNHFDVAFLVFADFAAFHNKGVPIYPLPLHHARNRSIECFHWLLIFFVNNAYLNKESSSVNIFQLYLLRVVYSAVLCSASELTASMTSYDFSYNKPIKWSTSISKKFLAFGV